LDYPNLKFWTEEERLGYQKDTMIDDIQYYCGASASQDGDSETAIKYFTLLLDVYEPQEEMYQFLIYEYGRLKDSVNLLEMYKIGVQKFPQNPFYARSLINVYLNKNDLPEAMIWIDKAIEEDSVNATLWDVKGRIFESEKNFEEAERCFLKAIEMDPDFEPALGNVGRIYYNRAVEELDRVNAIRDDRVYRREKAKMKEVFEKPLPYMEKAHELNPEERDYIIALRGIYYNLGKGFEKKYEEMDALMKQTR
jgi:tetratricopeptide (TPR) repeat protein